MTKYNLKPKIKLTNQGKVKSINSLIEIINQKKYYRIVIETYPGVDLQAFKKVFLNKIKEYKQYWSESYARQGQEFRNAIMDELTDDRVFGKWTRKEYKNFFIKQIKNPPEFIICYGIGANYLVNNYDLLIYIDIPRWEIQKRYRKGKRVFFGGTLENEVTKNFKRGYFIEWRMADKIKQNLYRKINYYIDGSNEKFNFINRDQLQASLKEITTRPFRLVPYFDYGVWGGKWMQEKFKLGANEFSRWAWGFDGVPEENSVILEYDNDLIEMPAINLVFFEAINLLGEAVWNRFGNDFPIRFDFLDTIKGGNLSLQVHPNFQYIRDNFWAPYTQEESYYIVDVDKQKHPVCYLGLKNKINKKAFINDLKKAQLTNKMNVKKYVNSFSVKKHDHLLHPAGVVHASGSGCMVLEISSTPYIFTFKLWDWARLGLNGKPRPINIEHGKKVIDYSFNTTRTKNELINQFKKVRVNENFDEERTGLHKRHYIETRRITLKTKKGAILKTHNSANMLNLVEGEQIIVESIDDSFKPLIINYAETFIIPEACKQFRIRNISLESKKAIIVQAFVRV